MSKSFTLKQGLPKRSILSPILFSIYLNNLDVILDRYTKLALFARDLVVSSSSANLEKVQHYLNKALTYPSILTRNLKFQINTNKSKICVFTINSYLNTFKPSVVLLDEILKLNENPKYLGIILDFSLCLHKHIQCIESRVKKRLNILTCISERLGSFCKSLKVQH